MNKKQMRRRVRKIRAGLPKIANAFRGLLNGRELRNIAATRKGLGRGLGSLLSEEAPSEPKENGAVETRLSQIEPNRAQPRKAFDNEKLEALAKSIKENGLIQPIVVTPTSGGRFKIVAGERRWRAARMAGLETVPTIIHDYTDLQAAQIALIENLQREDLNPIEEAMGYKKLLDDFNLTQETVSEKIGKSRSAVANTLRLLTLEDDIQKYIVSGELSAGHARAVLSVEDSSTRSALCEEIIKNKLNVRQAEALAKKLAKPKPEKKEKIETAYDIELDAIGERMTSKLGTKVSIRGGKKKGKIEIEYYGNRDLDRILTLLDM